VGAGDIIAYREVRRGYSMRGLLPNDTDGAWSLLWVRHGVVKLSICTLRFVVLSKVVQILCEITGIPEQRLVKAVVVNRCASSTSISSTAEQGRESQRAVASLVMRSVSRENY